MSYSVNKLICSRTRQWAQAVPLLFLPLLFCCCQAAIIDTPIKVVYPNPKSEIHASSTFIVGELLGENHDLECNEEKVKVNNSGFFAHVVKLNYGDNKFALQQGNKVLCDLTVKREIPAKFISADEFKIGNFEPNQDCGFKFGDTISFSAHATPNSSLKVIIGNREIYLRQPEQNSIYHNKKKTTVALRPKIVSNKDFAYGEASERWSQRSDDLYKGFYKITADDQWSGIHPKLFLEHGDKQLSIIAKPQFTTISQPTIAQTIHSQTVVRLGPGLARTTPLDTGVRLEIDGWVGNQMRCLYTPIKHVWVDKKDLDFETPLQSGRNIDSTASPYAVARTINVIDDGYGQTIKIPLTQRLPYQIEQKLNPNSLSLRIYGVTADTDWETINSESNKTAVNSTVDHITWKQVSDNEYEVTAHLQSKRQWGYRAYYDGTTLCLSIKRAPQLAARGNLSGIRICLDPGHGGGERGSIGCSGLPESNLNLAIAMKVKSLLEDKGATVIMTRTSDSQDVSLEERVHIANENQADLLLSIHNNALPDGRDPWKEHGTSSYWYHPQSIELARCLKDEIVKATAFPDLGARYQNLALARPTAMPAVLLEVGFMINPDEFAQLLDPTIQEKVAKAICNGIVIYMNGDNPSTPFSK